MHKPGTANAERRAEAPAGARIAVRHVGGAAFMRGDDRLQARMTGKRRQKGIDQSARHHEQVIEAFADQSVQNEIRAGGHADDSCGAPGAKPIRKPIRPCPRRTPKLNV